MLVKGYYSLWVLSAVAAALMFATGNLTMLAVVVFGFIAFGLTFMGMISVLPVWATHPPEMKAAKTEAAPPQPAATVAAAEGYPAFKSV
jgi:hypothetical protein